MKALIFKEWREHLKWVPIPGLVILLVFYIDKPNLPMPEVTTSYYFCLTAVGFGAVLGFLQIFFESHGDKRSLLLHRPLGPARIFLAKALAGVSLYLLAMAIPFVCLESWYATPGHMPAPYHWRTGLPWLADILSGLVFYFAGMLTAQRERAGTAAGAYLWQEPSSAPTLFGYCPSFGTRSWRSGLSGRWWVWRRGVAS